MATLVCFHAHPDDEALSTGGLMAKAAAAGHRVILLTATNGELGEVADGVLSPGEKLWERRLEELAASAAVLGAEEPRLLGYHDSGMMGEPSNNDPACFWQADVSAAAEQTAELLADVSIDALTIYDDHGLYGHPDHIQVHRVGLAAARLLGVDNVFEATINRDLARASFEQLDEELAEGSGSAAGAAESPRVEGPSPEELESFGVPDADLAFSIDVSAHVKAKRAAMVAHRTQIPPDSFFLSLPEERFALMFGIEWYAIPGRTGTGGPTAVELLPGLD